MDLDKFFDGFTIVFVPALISLLAIGIMSIMWAVASFFGKIVDGFKMQKQLQGMKFVMPSDAQTRDYVIQLRSRQDAQRLTRMKKKRDAAIQALSVDLPDGLPPNLKYVEKSEVDVTAEVFQEQARYLICAVSARGPKYFHSILKGRATEKGARDVRFHFTEVRSLGRRMTKAEATALMPHLPKGGHDLYIVEDKSNAIVEAKETISKVVEKLVESGITLDELKAALPLRSENLTDQPA